MTGLTVGELIQELSKLDPRLPVFGYEQDLGQFYEGINVTVRSLVTGHPGEDEMTREKFDSLTDAGELKELPEKFVMVR